MNAFGGIIILRKSSGPVAAGTVYFIFEGNFLVDIIGMAVIPHVYPVITSQAAVADLFDLAVVGGLRKE